MKEDRSDFDRRSSEDRLRVYHLGHFKEGRVEKGSGKKRRSNSERREGWLRVGKWRAVRLER